MERRKISELGIDEEHSNNDKNDHLEKEADCRRTSIQFYRCDEG